MSVYDRKFLVIVNPKAGKRRNKDWEDVTYKYLRSDFISIVETVSPMHSDEIIRQHAVDHEVCVVGIGGDGTISELAKMVYQMDLILGIIPRGSGNGLARHLKIPFNVKKAMRLLTTGAPSRIDLIKLNDRYCCNTSGIGFSGLISKYFGTRGKRGFITYFKLALNLHRESKCFDIILNDKLFKNVWSVEIANSSQLGNNAVVSPLASVSDGIMDILIMTKPTKWQIPGLIYSVFTKNILKSKLSHFIRASELDVKLPIAQDYHIDGEYRGLTTELDVKILPSALKIMI